ncbi:MAG: nucleotidyltransferase substrate binding protein [Desulfuromonadales bacterium]|nr:nucleotidyltransferase substrate binding protein [Desulfuromonadales bacterium]
MSIDFSPLEKAVNNLKRALDRAIHAQGDEELRDACIQRFEYTFELSWKMLKRQLEQELPNPTEVDGYSYRQLFRIGAERGLVQDVEAWFDYRERRNITSHTYDEAKAARVFVALPAFAKHAEELLAALKESSGKN